MKAASLQDLHSLRDLQDRPREGAIDVALERRFDLHSVSDFLRKVRRHVGQRINFACRAIDGTKHHQQRFGECRAGVFGVSVQDAAAPPCRGVPDDATYPHDDSDRQGNTDRAQHDEPQCPGYHGRERSGTRTHSEGARGERLRRRQARK